MKTLDLFCEEQRAWIEEVRNDLKKLRGSLREHGIEETFDGRLSALGDYLAGADQRIGDAVHCPTEVWMEIEDRATESWMRLRRDIEDRLGALRAGVALPCPD